MSRAAAWDANIWVGTGGYALLMLYGVFMIARPPRRLVEVTEDRPGRGESLRKEWISDGRGSGATTFLLGLMGVLTQQRVPDNPGLQIGLGLLLLALGGWGLFFQDRYRGWRRRRYQARLDDRLARGQDAYFEELREIRAYPPDRISRVQQNLGSALVLLIGLSFLALAITR